MWVKTHRNDGYSSFVSEASAHNAVNHPLAVRGMAGHTDIMDTKYADIEDGKRHDIVAYEKG